MLKPALGLDSEFDVPGVSIVARQAGFTVWALSVMGAVTLACLVVAVTLERVTMAITLTRNATFTACQSRTKTTWPAVLTVWPCSPV